jgi:outer membrane receptor protein involved in Fe transport
MKVRFCATILSSVTVITLLFFGTLTFGQGIVTGSISGSVQDPQGAVVPGANITATQLSTNRQYTAVTANTGLFAINVLPPGQYDIKIEAASFRSYESHAVTVAVGKDTSLGAVKLEVGSSAQTVTVEGASPLIETTTDQVTNTLNSQQVVSIPLGNNFDTLALYLPGIAPLGDSGFSNTNGQGFSANGQRGRANNFQLDGQNNNDNSVAGPSIFFGNQDAIQEIQVITNYSAEYGRNMGSQVNYITKAGTNAFHGTAYEFWQGDHFDSLENQEKSPLFSGANGPFCAAGQTSGCSTPVVPQYVDNRFGGTIGGPILKNKVWFFASTNLERQRTGGSPSTSPGLVPTVNGIHQLLAAFPNSPVGPLEQAIGPATITSKGNPTFSNIQNVLVTNQIDPTAGSAFTCTAAGVHGCAPIEMGNVTRFVPTPFNDYEATGRVDVKVTDKDNFFGRYIFQQQLFDGVNFGNGVDVGDWQTNPSRSQQIGLDWVHTFSNSFLNQARFSYSRASVFFEEGSQPSCNRTNPLGCATNIVMIGSAPQDSTNFGVAAGFPQGRIINVYQVQDNLTKIVGRHQFKFGGEYDLQRSPNVFLPFNNSEYVFGSFSDIAANNPIQSITAVGNANLPFHENDVDFYFQDDWRVKDNLTLNLGLRWEWYQQAINLLHDRTVQVQNSSNPLWDNSFPASQTEVPSVPNNYRNFGPVFGFAWTPGIMKSVFGEQKTVIRGGFRIAYDPAFYNMFLNVATSAPSVNLATLIPGAPLPPSGNYQGSQVLSFIQSTGLLNTSGPPPVNPGLRNHTTVAPNFRNPYSQQWNFGIQRSFSSRVVGEVRYVGNHGVHQFQTINGNPALNALLGANPTGTSYANVIPAGFTPCTNPALPGGHVPPGGTSAGYSHCNFTRVLQRGNFAWSKYNGVQTQLRMGGWHGITATASYTYSRTFDNASEVYSSFAGGNTLSFAQDPFNTDVGERAISGLDFPHLVGVTVVYEIPYKKNQKGFMGHLLGGWQPGVTYRYASGQPLTVIDFHNPSSLCDPTSTMSASFDACRPILSNSAAPQTAVGQFTCTGPTASTCSLADFVTGAPTTLSAVHWVANDPNAATFYGTPYAGVGRNTVRGQPISTANLGIHKDTHVTERLTMEFQMQCFNCMNVQFRGSPVSVLGLVGANAPGTPSPFLSTDYNFNGGGNNFVGGGTFSANSVYDGIARRRLLFGAKLIF